MAENHNGIILDRHFSNALIKNAYKNGYVEFEENGELDRDLINKFKSNREYGLLEKKCLELILLFDKVYLNDPCEFAVLEKLKFEGIVRQSRYLNDVENTVDYNDIQLGENIKPLLINHLVKHFQKRQPHLKEQRGLAKKYVDGLFDFINLWRIGLHEEAVNYTHLPLERLLDTGNPVDYIYSLLKREESYPGFVVDMLDMEFELSSIISLMKMSEEFKVPFISKRVSCTSNETEGDNMHEVYKLCLVQMKDEIQYIPRIESIDDLLRLREKKEIKRFREVLIEWKNLMNNGDIKLAEKIRSDILKANKEISKLDKWEKVDNWFYYLAVPTMFIPIISNVVTVGGPIHVIILKVNKKNTVG
ncbi:hypothetical protein DF16_orf03823 [Bacillus thuringiensis serovar kurstaki str. YBT-1520]|uniref:hypothetical protein n=1 Tax=Bacillus thuringiensis TaxID=1428 RepID=UPI0004F8A01D|nr:hypothetical protein [Bacillus thuringiensis]AIM32238.1 hypothetical protein DF16_orf03823 [Bacillus thuringiensis serovar kurstaki str. YBT-1520]